MLTKSDIQQLILYLDRAVNDNIESIRKSYSKTSYQDDKFEIIAQVCRVISESQILRDKLVKMLEDNHLQS